MFLSSELYGLFMKSLRSTLCGTQHERQGQYVGRVQLFHSHVLPAKPECTKSKYELTKSTIDTVGVSEVLMYH